MAHPLAASATRLLCPVATRLPPQSGSVQPQCIRHAGRITPASSARPSPPGTADTLLNVRRCYLRMSTRHWSEEKAKPDPAAVANVDFGELRFSYNPTSKGTHLLRGLGGVLGAFVAWNLISDSPLFLIAYCLTAFLPFYSLGQFLKASSRTSAFIYDKGLIVCDEPLPWSAIKRAECHRTHFNIGSPAISWTFRTADDRTAHFSHKGEFPDDLFLKLLQSLHVDVHSHFSFHEIHGHVPSA